MVGEGECEGGERGAAAPSVTDSLLLGGVEGRSAQGVRSGFKIRPGQDWSEQWALLAPTVFRD